MALTIQQLGAATYEGGHAIVRAVAGSGKTTTMLHRLLHLVRAGADSRRILVMMFNKGARDDFETRLHRLFLDNALRPPEVLTFHAFGFRLCERLHKAGLLPSSPFVNDNRQLLAISRELLGSLNQQLPEDQQIDLYGDAVMELLEVIDLMKGVLHGIPQVRHAIHPALKDVDKRYLTAFDMFESRRESSPFRGFSDLIYDPVMLMLNEPDVAEFVSNRYDHIIVDEYQDINEAQMQMLRFVAGTRAAVCVVGDEDQCIYAWRGAEPEYMTRLFMEEFADAQEFMIDHTFRYGHKVSMMANHVILNNKQRADKICVSGGRPDTAVNVLMASAGNSGAPVVEEIGKWRDSGRLCSEVAILVREYTHSIPVETALLGANIPYRIVGAPPFFDRREILSLRGSLQMCCGGLGRIHPEKVKDMVSAMLTVPSLFLRGQVLDRLISQICRAPENFLQIMDTFSRTHRFSSQYGQRKFKDAVDNWSRFSKRPAGMPAYQMLLDIFSSQDFYEALKKCNARQDVAFEKRRMIEQFAAFARAGQFSVQDFASYLFRLTDEYGAMNENADAVLITSIHRAKGLEWPYVILPELAEGKLPAYTDMDPPGDDAPEIEDERRLFYVAMTRAQEVLTMIAPMDAMLQDWSNSMKTGHPDLSKIIASRFLYEANINASYVIGKALEEGLDMSQLPSSPLLTRYLAGLTG